MWIVLSTLTNVGGMAEWSIAPVLKTGDSQGSVGSNPTTSANIMLLSSGERLGLINPGERSDGLRRKGSNPLRSTNHGDSLTIQWVWPKTGTLQFGHAAKLESRGGLTLASVKTGAMVNPFPRGE